MPAFVEISAGFCFGGVGSGICALGGRIYIKGRGRGRGRASDHAAGVVSSYRDGLSACFLRFVFFGNVRVIFVCCKKEGKGSSDPVRAVFIAGIFGRMVIVRRFLGAYMHKRGQRMENRKLHFRGSFTVEAAFLAPLILFSIAGGIHLGFTLYGEVKETTVISEEINEFYPVEIVRKKLQIDQILETGEGD